MSSKGFLIFRIDIRKNKKLSVANNKNACIYTGRSYIFEFLNEVETNLQSKSETALVALRQILRATEMNSRNLAQEVGLTPSQHIILQIANSTENAVPSAIARAASITQATVTLLINKLEQQGLVERRRDSKDKRRVLIELTEGGKKALKEAPDLLQDRFETRFLKLQEWEQSMLVTSLERIAAILGAEEIEAAPLLDIGAIDKSLERE